MIEPTSRHEEPDHTRAAIVATTIVVLTCILSCAAVIALLIMRTT